ncbi:peptidyl-prolyl cis-trans isomerase [Marinobacter sp. chi1]|uniref:Peptidyl-prolyl cis-trans isomerase n=1 Tax=Marinobacter suaedae TaxID=3057675 RepID=A0ABT8W3K6_9GAMM|nr:peptidyl-prolyl cis-trans isomerase [Marinobacter sp. chi1]MDO3722825.1 peptidyl-prolyl cis-trans isomerase [Marinobacter sp. chi1]
MAMPHRLMTLAKEPLIHILLIGALLFALYSALNPQAMEDNKRILIDQGQINSLQQQFARAWNRQPTEEELQGLIENFVIEEIYYREALALGIDKNDPVIRRRLRQKMEIYTDNLANALAPSDEQLTQYLEEHPDKFRTDDRYSFEHIYLNTDQPTAELRKRVAEAERAIGSGQPITGDPSLLPSVFDDVSGRMLDKTFGQGFALQLEGLDKHAWQGPIRSSMGIHFVRLTEHAPGGLPELASVRDKVEREWRFDRAQALDQSFRERLLANYDVTVVTKDDQ